MENLLITTEGNILICTLHRPDKLNALSCDLLNELDSLLQNVAQDNQIQALLITGSGRAFCAGADISQLAKADAATGLSFAERGQSLFRQLETLGKPSLAAINGAAMGGGCEMAMAATLRIGSTAAKFAQPEVKLGVIPGYGGTVRLSRLVGKGRALDLCLSGRSIDAETALNWGLITEMTEPDALINRGISLLNEITQHAPLAIRAVMQTIDLGYNLTQTEAFKLEALEFAMTCSTEDKKEGVAAFLEKRSPNFTGK